MYLPILTYHRILPQTSTQEIDPKRISVSAEQFRRHLQWLHWFGYSTVRLEDYAQELKRRGRRCGVKCIAITFDDGYKEVLTLALPILLEFGFTATVFAVPAEAHNHWDDGQAPLMTTADLLAWRRAGMGVGAHSCHHVHLTKVAEDVARKEIADSKKMLEEALGEKVPLFAYPYGETDDRVDLLAREAGFVAAFATDNAPRDHADNLFRLRRTVVFPRNNAWEILWKAQKWYPRYQDLKRRPGESAKRG